MVYNPYNNNLKYYSAFIGKENMAQGSFSTGLPAQRSSVQAQHLTFCQAIHHHQIKLIQLGMEEGVDAQQFSSLLSVISTPQERRVDTTTTLQWVLAQHWAGHTWLTKATFLPGPGLPVPTPRGLLSPSIIIMMIATNIYWALMWKVLGWASLYAFSLLILKGILW